MHSKEINLIKEEIQIAAQAPGDRVFTLLHKLKRKVDALEDNELSGFLYYSYAYAYSFREDHDAFIRHLKRAVGYLLRTGQQGLLARAYNLFAIEAQNYGCFEVAFDYYSIAESLVQDEKDSLEYAYIEANTGDLLAQMGDYRQAVSHIRKSIPVVRKHKEEVWSYQNTILGLVNLAMCHMSSGNKTEAEKILQKAENLLQKAGDRPVEGARLWCVLGRARLAVAKREKKRLTALAEEAKNEVILGEGFGEFIRETLYYCQELIKAGELTIAKEVISALEKREASISSGYLTSLFMQCKIEYYKAIGNQKKVMRCYETRHGYFKRQQQIQKMVYLESIDFLHLLEELRKEEAETKQENAVLQQRAETDSLTGLPNRYAMNHHWEDAFRIAKKKKHRIGIGIADVNEFKRYNDTHGHADGDRLLIQIAGEVREVAEDYGLRVYRYGGDEFVIIYEGLDEGAIRYIEEEVLERTKGRVSHGFYSGTPGSKDGLWDYLAKADERLYRKKKRRGN